MSRAVESEPVTDPPTRPCARPTRRLFDPRPPPRFAISLRASLTASGLAAPGLRRGKDARTFLQNLTTNSVAALGAGQALFSAILTRKGRTLHEVVIHCVAAEADGEDAFLVDCARPQTAALLKLLLQFRLRSKVDLADLSADLGVAAFLPPSASLPGLTTSAGAAAPEAPGAPGARILVRDPRSPLLGWRGIVPRSAELSASSSSSSAPLADYRTLRMLAGVPEGAEVADTVPLEWNLEQLHGVAFDKGCYVGQELVARTHFKGVLRKRVFPVALFAREEAPSVAVLDPWASATGATTDPRAFLVSTANLAHSALHSARLADSAAPQTAAWIMATAAAWFEAARTPTPSATAASATAAPVALPSLVRADAEEDDRALGSLVAMAPSANVGLAVVRMEALEARRRGAFGRGQEWLLEGTSAADGSPVVAIPVLPPYWASVDHAQQEAEARMKATAGMAAR